MEKACSKCGETKDASEFGKCRARRDGLQGWCRACHRAYGDSNKARISENNRARYNANRHEKLEYQRAYREANKERVAEYKRKWVESNRERLGGYMREYQNKRLSEDPVFAMVSRLRCRLRKATYGQGKPASVMDLVGCSKEKLCAWLEMHFDEGMTWENRGEWHIDHIKPIASFEDPADPACWHWSNLQPLWAEDNLKKGDRC